MICTRESRGILEILKYFPERLYLSVGRIPIIQLAQTEEIRLGAGCPVALLTEGKIRFVSTEGKLVQNPSDGVITSAGEIEEIFRLLCDGSVYSMQESIKQGFVITGKGHRVGICGKVIVKDGKAEGIRDISFLNIRIAREIVGCAEAVAEVIGSKPLKSTLIISPPGGGKTTYIRDLCRIFGGSEKYNYKVGIADERSEIAAAVYGIPQNDVGKRSCVIDGCPKRIAMDILLRTMGVDIIVTDELGGAEDISVAENVMNCGVKIFATMHGESMEDVKRKTDGLLGKGNFENIIFLADKKVREMVFLDG